MYYIVEVRRDAAGAYGIVKMRARDEISAKMIVQTLNMQGGGRYAYTPVEGADIRGDLSERNAAGTSWQEARRRWREREAAMQ